MALHGNFQHVHVFSSHPRELSAVVLLPTKLKGIEYSVLKRPDVKCPLFSQVNRHLVVIDLAAAQALSR